MTRNKAIKLAIESMRKQRQVYAFERNMFQRCVITISTRRNKKKYDELTEAMEVLGADTHQDNP